jgi:hypothetical protein
MKIGRQIITAVFAAALILSALVQSHPLTDNQLEVLTKARAGTIKKLDLTGEVVRDAVRTSAEALFSSHLAKEYM